MTAHGTIGETMRKSVQLVQRAGKGGDTRLAHVNPKEARMLKASGGSGKTNKRTGLKSFEGGGNDGSTVVRRFRAADAPASSFNKGQFVIGSAPKTRTVGGAPVKQTGGGGLVTTGAPGASLTSGKGKGFVAPVIPKAAVVAPVAKATPKKPSPISRTFIGAINRSSGNTKSSALDSAAVKRAKLAGQAEEDIVSSVDKSRARSPSKGIVIPVDQSGL